MANNQKFKAVIIGIDGSITTVGSLPTASESYRDALARVFGASGASDLLLYCKKQADDTYVWVSVVEAAISSSGLTLVMFDDMVNPVPLAGVIYSRVAWGLCDDGIYAEGGP